MLIYEIEFNTTKLFLLACPTGHYGVNCSDTCSPHCQADTCDHVTGVCISGCEDGYKGQLCRKRKLKYNRI